MFVALRGEPYLLWRAVDEHGAELDVLLQKRRDEAAAKRYFGPIRQHFALKWHLLRASVYRKHLATRFAT